MAVSVPPGSIVIETSVYPVTFNITSKSGLYPVGNTYLGLTFTDVLYREYVMPGTTLGTSTAQQYISNILYPFSNAILANSMGYSSGILTPSEIYAIMNNGTYAIVETYGATTMDYNPRTVLGYEPVNNYYSMAGYVLPDLMGFFVNSSSPTTGLTPLYMTSIFPNVFKPAPSIVVFNLTMGIPTYSTILGTTATAYPPNDTLLYAPSASYSEYRLLINETLLPPTYVSLNGTSGQPSATLLETIYPTTYAAEISQQYYSVINFTYVIPSYVYPASYRLWEAYINATGMSSITNATIGIYAANATGWYFVYSVNETSLFQEAMTRTIPLYLPLNVAEIESTVEGANAIAVVLYVYGSGSLYILPPAAAADHVHVQYPVLSTGFGGTVEEYTSANLYVNSTGTGTMTITYSYPVPNTEWYPYFGSPLTVVIPVPSSGEAVFDLPWWAPTTGAYGTRIARFWVMGASSGSYLVTPNIGYGSITAVITPGQYTPTAPSPLPELAISSYVLLNYITPEQGASTVYTGEIPPGTVSSSGSLYMTAIGAGTGGTSAPMLMYDTLFPENLWNVTMSTMPANGVYNIRTIALESVDIYNNASFPIFVTGFTYSSAGSSYPLSVPTLRLPPQEQLRRYLPSTSMVVAMSSHQHGAT